MSNLLKLVQIGKRELGLDDDMYRDMLQKTVGQRSSKNLSEWQLSKVLDHMKALGFKPKPKPAAKPQTRLPECKKILAIWITMRKQGFLKNASDAALDAFVKRMTSQINGGQGIEKLNWLKSEDAYHVLEALKRWHYRVMKEAILAAGGRIPSNDDCTGPAGYGKLAEYYQDFIRK